MRFIFNRVRFALKEIKFIPLKPLTFSTTNLNETKCTSKSIYQGKRSDLQVADPVCMYFPALFERVCSLQRYNI